MELFFPAFLWLVLQLKNLIVLKNVGFFKKNIMLNRLLNLP